MACSHPRAAAPVSLFARLIGTLINIVLIFGLAPVLAGAEAWMAARFLRTPPPPAIQPWRDLARLIRKQRLQPDFAAPLYAALPLAALAATGTAALLVPGFVRGMATAPLADLLVIIGLIAASRAVLVLASLDSGTGLAGIEAARAALRGVLADGVWLLVVLVLGLIVQTASLDRIVLSVAQSWPHALPSLGLGLVAALIGAGIAGMNDPGLVQDYAGPEQAIFAYEAMLRRIVLVLLIVDMFVPFGIGDAGVPLSWPLGLVAMVVKLGVAAIILAVARVILPRGTESRAQLGVAILLALAGALLAGAAL